VRDPYRILFPVGVAFAVLGTGVWPLALVARIPYPGTLHANLMIEGFELAFVSGFLLTILPRLTRTDPVGPRETGVALLLLLAFGAAALVGQAAVAHGCALALLLLLAATLIGRMRARRNDPPEEIAFVPFGLALGIAGAAVLTASAAGVFVEPSFRLGLRLLSLGMILAFVLGFGTLLVPTFLEIKDPLVIPRIARPHERPRRRLLYVALGSALVLTFVAEAAGARTVGAFGRAVVASVLLGFGWKIWRRPGRRTFPAMILWTAGWMIGAGVWAAALLPHHEIAALHVLLIGGYGTLTIGIASRVVVTHGGHGPDREARLITPLRAALLALALVTRLAAEADPAHAAGWLAAAAVCWILAWAGWFLTARRALHAL
jgi:uncharacterized protein involved in response to NO